LYYIFASQKQNLRAFFHRTLLFFLLFSGLNASATHLVGGYMNYEFTNINSAGNYVYKVSFHVYRDCFGGANIPLDDEITLGVYLNDGAKSINQRPKIKLITKYNVKPPGSIDCDDYTKSVCIEYGFYEGLIVLKPNTSGYHVTYTRCCRNFQNNLTDDGSQPDQGQTYYCFIPNTSFKNSSPAFYGVPSPYMCSYDTTSFLFDAIDKDGDSLVYRFMRPYQGGSTTISSPVPPDNLNLPLVTYKGGYNSTQPFGTGGYIDIAPSTGHTHLYSPQTGRFVVGVEVSEYRDGTFLGTIRMDLQILVLDCKPNNAPDISSDKGNRFIIEEGEELCFNVTATDPDDDLIRLKGRGGILGSAGGIQPGTKATFRDTFGIATVTSEFCWIPDCDMARTIPYFVYFTAEDDGCPPKFNNLDVEIVVIDFVGATKLDGPVNVCQFNKYEYTVIDGNSQSDYEWDISGGTIVGPTTLSKATINWTAASTGTVRVREVSKNGCLGEWITLTVSVKQSPTLPIILGIDTVCLNEPSLVYSVANRPGNTYLWEAIDATLAITNQNQTQIGVYSAPGFTLKVSETNAFGCTSDTAKLEVFVSEPKPTILGSKSVCPNARGIVYSIEKPEQGSIYQWNIVGGTQTSGGSSNQITINWGDEGFGQVEVIETNRHGCISPTTTLVVNKSYILESTPILGPIAVCEFDQNVLYSTLNVNGNIYKWTLSGGVQATGDSTNSITVNWGAAGLGSVTLIKRAYDNVNNKECLSLPEVLDVVINPVPVAQDIQGAIEVCQFDDSVSYSIAGLAGSTYTWSVNGDSSGIVGQGTNQIKIVWDIAGTFTLDVIELSSGGCKGPLVDTLVLVNPKPNTTPIDGPNVVCIEDILQKSYSVSGFATSTYSWTVYGASNFTGNGTSTVVVDWIQSPLAHSLFVLETSDKGCAGEPQRMDVTIDALDIDLRYVSVGTPDDRMIIDWQLANSSQTPSFDIQKRTAGSGSAWQTIATVPGNVFNYTETQINTDVSAYEYRILALNKCGKEIASDTHTSILLKGEQDENFNTKLNFSAYLGWQFGVNNYTVYTADNVRPYTVLQSGANAGVPVLVVQEPSEYRKCYRVFAEEQDGERTASWSNEICFYYSPEIYVPNAFTANEDGLNDGFGVIGTAINTFAIQIYNRWGERLYESTDIDEKWIPRYQDADVQMGTYIYVITYTDFENKVFQKTGTINLLR
jgi:gliding motility-associated-like protein